MDQSRIGRTVAKTGALVGGAAAGAAAGWAAYSALFVNHRVPLAPAVDAERLEVATRAGKLSYYTAGSGGRPVLLLHSINAAASAYEMRPLFDRYRTQRRVYALDLPGFGFSERTDRVYSPELYSVAIFDFLDRVGTIPADVVALSLSCEFAARAAISRPQLFRSLTFISPTGFDDSPKQASESLRRALSLPFWGRPVFDLLVSKPSIAYFLKKSFAGPVDPGLADYDYATSHQPGARYAPFYFISGALFTPDALEVYSRLRCPVMALYDQSGYDNLDRLPDFARKQPNWTAVRIPGTKGLPHFEKPVETARALDRFWAERMTA